MRIGLAQEEVARRGWAITAAGALSMSSSPDVAFIDLREGRERERHGVIAGSIHAPYPALVENMAPGGLLRALARSKQLVFYCAFGERSAMAVQAAQDAGIMSARHLHGGVGAWKAAGGALATQT
jgi:rhodanese-related sulfurtransferase